MNLDGESGGLELCGALERSSMSGIGAVGQLEPYLGEVPACQGKDDVGAPIRDDRQGRIIDRRDSRDRVRGCDEEADAQHVASATQPAGNECGRDSQVARRPVEPGTEEQVCRDESATEREHAQAKGKIRDPQGWELSRPRRRAVNAFSALKANVASAAKPTESGTRGSARMNPKAASRTTALPTRSTTFKVTAPRRKRSTSVRTVGVTKALVKLAGTPPLWTLKSIHPLARVRSVHRGLKRSVRRPDSYSIHPQN